LAIWSSVRPPNCSAAVVAAAQGVGEPAGCVNVAVFAPACAARADLGARIAPDDRRRMVVSRPTTEVTSFAIAAGTRTGAVRACATEPFASR
jgi:hypothetical protein